MAESLAQGVEPQKASLQLGDFARVLTALRVDRPARLQLPLNPPDQAVRADRHATDSSVTRSTHGGEAIPFASAAAVSLAFFGLSPFPHGLGSGCPMPPCLGRTYIGARVGVHRSAPRLLRTPSRRLCSSAPSSTRCDAQLRQRRRDGQCATGGLCGRRRRNPCQSGHSSPSQSMPIERSRSVRFHTSMRTFWPTR